MTAPFLALITPIGETVTPPQPPLGIWGPTDPRPTHPIAPGGQPPRPWGPINYPDQGLPGNQPYPDQGLPGNQPYEGWEPARPRACLPSRRIRSTSRPRVVSPHWAFGDRPIPGRDLACRVNSQSHPIPSCYRRICRRSFRRRVSYRRHRLTGRWRGPQPLDGSWWAFRTFRILLRRGDRDRRQLMLEGPNQLTAD